MNATETEIKYYPSVPALRFDWIDWLAYLENEDVPEKQKREMIETLWSVVVAFVDLGWRVESGPETGVAFDLQAILTATDIGAQEEV